MKLFYLIFSILFVFTSCGSEQWEDRVANGDTGSVTHGKNTPPDTSTITKVNFPDGRKLFKEWCASCHNDSYKRSTGPGLMGVLDRIPSREWAHGFVHNADSVIRSGDAYANKIYLENNKIHQNKFPTLSKEEIDAILDYCNVGHDPRLHNVE